MKAIKTIISSIAVKQFSRIKRKREEFLLRKKNAEALVNTIVQSTSIQLCTHNFNMNGEEIRGWHRASPRFARDNNHPLVTYYKNK